MRHAVGAPVVVRTVTGGRVRWAAAAVCVADDDEQLAFFQSNLVPNKVTAAAAARWPDRRARELALREELQRREFPLVDKVPRRGEPTLTVARWGDGFSARFVVHRDAWRPEYVNVCHPFRRSAVGFDTDDLCLDLEIDVLAAPGRGAAVRRELDPVVTRSGLAGPPRTAAELGGRPPVTKPIVVRKPNTSVP